MNKEKLDIHLELHSTPLSKIREDENWWHLGTISVSKKHATFTAGYGHPINSGTKLRADWFELGEKRGWAIILDSGGTPPEYFIGWLPADDEMKARQWVDTLNGEIRARLADAGRAQPEPQTHAERLTFEQGNEFAPDAPWGYQRVTLGTDGQIEYEHKERGAHRLVRGRVNAERVRAMRGLLARTAFPTPPETTFLPGSSLTVLTTDPPQQRMLIDYFTALKLDGYRELIRELSSLNEALRESKTDILDQWAFEPT